MLLWATMYFLLLPATWNFKSLVIVTWRSEPHTNIRKSDCGVDLTVHAGLFQPIGLVFSLRPNHSLTYKYRQVRFWWNPGKGGLNQRHANTDLNIPFPSSFLFVHLIVPTGKLSPQVPDLSSHPFFFSSLPHILPHLSAVFFSAKHRLGKIPSFSICSVIPLALPTYC